MTQLYVLDLRSCASRQWLELIPTLPEYRQAKALACRMEADRVRSAGAGWLLQNSLVQAGIPMDHQVFVTNPWGKPQLEGRENLHLSLSHSGHWAVCALSDHPVGIDVEAPRCTPAVARRFFRPDELTSEDPVFLTRLWTAKEAFVKALGRGLTIPLDSFAVRLTEHNADLQQTQSPLPYRLHEYRLEEDLLCLCATDDRPTPVYIHP